ncbi:hypothetical protein FACS1894182_05210 [Bacteroidia bacterium]|nr:hypothetical protein FACS1894182_05210 [Bacteroidia bacterium]
MTKELQTESLMSNSVGQRPTNGTALWSLSRPHSGQTGIAGGKLARRAVRNPRWESAPADRRPVEVQQTDCPDRNDECVIIEEY